MCTAAGFVFAAPPALAGARTSSDDPIVGFWNFSGGVVQVEGSGASFRGVVVKPTKFAACVHQAGEVMWKITRTGSRYTGTHRWFNGDDCRPTTARPGKASWSIGKSGDALVLHFCTTSPSGGQQSCTDLARAVTLVDIAKVSNGCGGAGMTTKAQNYGLNTSVYQESALEKYTVSFKAACNLHDAGYSGAVVRDNLHGGVIVDFSTWSRRRVDDKFVQDMQALCRLAIPHAPAALAKCVGSGGGGSIGAVSRYAAVREIGDAYFDADPNTPGRQRTGPRANN